MCVCVCVCVCEPLCCERELFFKFFCVLVPVRASAVPSVVRGSFIVRFFSSRHTHALETPRDLAMCVATKRFLARRRRFDGEGALLEERCHSKVRCHAAQRSRCL